MPSAAHRRRGRGKRGRGGGGHNGNGQRNGRGVRQHTARDQETIDEAERLLDLREPDLVGLRKLAATRGLVNKQLRRRVWPILLEVDTSEFSYHSYLKEATGEHRDSRVVEVDVVRSLWSFTRNWSDSRRDGKRESLKRVLNGAVCSQEGVYYYQGLHDIASVLLLTLDEELAYATLRALTTTHLRDFTRNSALKDNHTVPDSPHCFDDERFVTVGLRPTLEPVNEVLRLLHPLLFMHDRQLYNFIERCEEIEQINMGMTDEAERRQNKTPPYYAISWVITWFSHSIDSLQAACRLFDLFFAAHPLMPLYVAVVALGKYRRAILECDVADFPGVHTTLKNMDIPSHATLDELCCDALKLFFKFPPSLVRKAAKRQGVQVSRSVMISLPDYTHGTIWDAPEKQHDILFAERMRPVILQAIPSIWTTATALSIVGVTALSLYQLCLQEAH